MQTRDKWGIAIFVALFALFSLILVWTYQTPSGPVRQPEDSVFVRQRILNLEKSNPER
jgi:hypothetical protein